DLNEVHQLHHAAVTRTHVDIVDVRRRGAILALDLNNDVVLFATVAETRDLAPAQHGFQCAPHFAHIDAHVGQLVAVHTYLQFRRVQSQVGVEVLQTGVIGQPVHQQLHHGGHFRVRSLAHDHEVDGFGGGPLPE